MSTVRDKYHPGHSDCGDTLRPWGHSQTIETLSDPARAVLQSSLAAQSRTISCETSEGVISVPFSAGRAGLEPLSSLLQRDGGKAERE